MAEKSISCILIIGLDLKGFQHTTYGTDDLLTFFIFDHTVIYGNDPMTLLLINPGNYVSLPVTAKSCMNFVSVIIGIFHSNDRLYFSEFFQKAFCNSLFPAKLLLVGYTLITATAAFLRN